MSKRLQLKTWLKVSKSITIEIAEVNVAVRTAGDSEEAQLRAAAGLVNERYRERKTQLGINSKPTVLAMIALEFAAELQQLQQSASLAESEARHTINSAVEKIKAVLTDS